MEVAQDRGSNAKQLAEIVSNDQSVSARVLKLANSAFYGFSRQITNITQAVVVLGFDTVDRDPECLEIEEAKLAENDIPEIFAEMVSGVSHANGVFRITLARQEENDSPCPVVRLFIPEMQIEIILQGMVDAVTDIRGKIQGRFDTETPPAPDKKTGRKAGAKSK